MMSSPNSTSRLATLAETVTWHLRGVVETESVRRIKFGLRDLYQRGEIARRTEWARSLAGEPQRVTLDRELGFRTNPFDGMIDLEPVCRLGEQLSTAIKEAPQAHNKAFHVNRLLPAASLDVMLAVALHEDLLRAATLYLGIVPVLGDVDFFYSRPIGSTTPFRSSQLYHCDFEAPTQVKFFVYCGDVGEHDGPLELVDASRSKMVRDRINYRFGGRRYRVQDETMSSLVPDHQHSVVGPRGTSLLLDTARCFHRGSRIRGEDRRRMVGVIQFVPPSSTTLPLPLRNGAPFRHLVDRQQSPLARAVLGEQLA
jgi:hypothetical protein